MSMFGWVVLAIGNVPIYIFIGWVIFGDWEGFKESMDYWGRTEETLSVLNDEAGETFWGGMKVWFWFLCCLGCVVGERMLFKTFLLPHGS